MLRPIFESFKENMTAQQALDYIALSVKEGYMSDEVVLDLYSLPMKEMIKQCEEMTERGDYYANEHV